MFNIQAVKPKPSLRARRYSSSAPNATVNLKYLVRDMKFGVIAAFDFKVDAELFLKYYPIKPNDLSIKVM